MFAQFYFLSYQLSTLLARSSLHLLQLSGASQLWVCVSCQLALASSLLLHESRILLLPSFVDPAVIVVLTGAVHGVAFVNTFNLISAKIPAKHREFAMGICSTATTAGPVIAALIGVAVEGRVAAMAQA